MICYKLLSKFDRTGIKQRMLTYSITIHGVRNLR